MKMKAFRITYYREGDENGFRFRTVVKSKHLSGAVKQFYQMHDGDVVCKVEEWR